ncbi:MAG: hypothetical protein JXA13_15020 [Anaerolineales bacterium]|nr:hypothetical protein [Anaerolineales bacterium]
MNTPDEMVAVEALLRLVWPGNETEVLPVHILITAVENGGLVLGACKDGAGVEKSLLGFLFGFPGVEYVTWSTACWGSLTKADDLGTFSTNRHPAVVPDDSKRCQVTNPTG